MVVLYSFGQYLFMRKSNIKKASLPFPLPLHLRKKIESPFFIPKPCCYYLLFLFILGIVVGGNPSHEETFKGRLRSKKAKRKSQDTKSRVEKRLVCGSKNTIDNGGGGRGRLFRPDCKFPLFFFAKPRVFPSLFLAIPFCAPPC